MVFDKHSVFPLKIIFSFNKHRADQMFLSVNLEPSTGPRVAVSPRNSILECETYLLQLHSKLLNGSGLENGLGHVLFIPQGAARMYSLAA